MPHLNEMRTLRIYLPAGYHGCEARYPVIYMMDGQNLFGDGSTCISGISWGVDASLARLEKEGAIKGIIVVGIDNAGDRRFDEYSPWNNECAVHYPIFKGRVLGGGGQAFSEFFTHELKPWVDRNFRTDPQARSTAIAGSSMGALISLYIIARYPEMVSCLGAFSIASWFCEDKILEYLDHAIFSDGHRFFLQAGTAEAGSAGMDDMEQVYLDCTLHLQEKLLKRGVPANAMRMIISAGDIHHESSWRKHFPQFVRYAFKTLRQRKDMESDRDI